MDQHELQSCAKCGSRASVLYQGLCHGCRFPAPVTKPDRLHISDQDVCNDYHARVEASAGRRSIWE